MKVMRMWPAYAGRGTQLSLLIYLSVIEGGEWPDRVQCNACMWLSIASPDSVHAAATSDCHKLHEADKSMSQTLTILKLFSALSEKEKHEGRSIWVTLVDDAASINSARAFNSLVLCLAKRQLE